MSAARDANLQERIFDSTRAVLIADATGVADKLATRLGAEGIQPLMIHCDDTRGLDELLADVPLDRRTLIVFAAGMKTNVDGRTGTLARRWPEDGQECPSYKGLADCSAVPSLLQLAQT